MGYNKYRVAPKKERTADGILFASKREMKRYLQLRLLERKGTITGLQLQPEFVLQEPFKWRKKKIQGIKYFADFSYIENGNYVVEDCKGCRTAAYLLKKKLLLHKYPEIDFRET